MVIEMPRRKERQVADDERRDRRVGMRFTAAIQLRLTAAQHRGLEMVAEQRGESISEVARDAVNRFLDGFVDERTGVTLLDELERDVAQERVQVKKLIAAEERKRAAT
jgi:hypothetical protein